MNGHFPLRAFAAALLLAGLVGCVDGGGPLAREPGHGPAAERGFGAAAPLISALSYFRANRHAYPDALEELVDDYVPTPQMLRTATLDGNRPFEYRRTGGEYELGFRYAGGRDVCRYRPSTAWRCVAAD